MSENTPPKSFLFVCYLNSIRSPIAEGLMRHRFPDAKVQSCGISTGELDDLMVAIMREKGIDMSAHQGKTLNDVSAQKFDHIIAFTEKAGEAAKAVFDGTEALIEIWPLPDPTHGSLDVRSIMNNYRAIRDNLDARLARTFG